MLALLLLAQQVLAGDLSAQLLKQTEYELRHVPSCPDIGYTLLHEPGLNSLTPGACFLCFCQRNSTALCWRRQNTRCDQESYQHHISKRIKRAPIGLSDIFFRDAAREVFDRQNPEQCKPFEGSYSEGCPPDDWCIGCTVCDCDANGRWDCHILSFCDDKKGKVQVKKRKGPVRRTKVRKGQKSVTHKSAFVTPVPIKKVANNLAKKTTNKPKPNMKQPVKKPHIVKKPQKVNNKNKKGPASKKVPPKQTNKNIVRKMIDRKALAKKPGSFTIKTQKPKKPVTKKPNNTMHLSKESMKQVMSAVKKMIIQHNNKTTQAYKRVTKAQQAAVTRMAAEVQKMAMTQKPKKHKKKSDKNKMIYNYKNKKAVVAPMYPPPRRQKRDVIFRTKYNVVNGTGNQKITGNNNEPISTVTTRPVINSTYDPYTTVDDKERYIYTVDYSVNSTQANVSQNTNPENYVFMNLVDNMLNGIRISKVSHGIVKEKGNHSRTKDIYSFISKDMTAKNENRNMNTQKVDMKEKILKKHYHNAKMINDASDGKKKSGEKDIGNCKTEKGRLKSNEIKDVLRTLLREMTSNTTTIPLLKNSKFSFVKYFRKVFKKYFVKTHKNETATPKYRKNNNLKIRHIIQLICENTGPCRVSPKNKIRLKSKIIELNFETKKILKIINVIKGLLHLLEVPYKKDESKEGSVNAIIFNDDVQKLNAILKDAYLESGTELTPTQLTQIEYVKQNTKEFIKAVGRFATILHEIIDLLHTNKYNIRGRRKKDPLRNLKALILKYNLVQNSFMQKMYQFLSKFDAKFNIGATTRKVSQNRELNNTVAIENFSRSIIQNLRKLKNLAQALNSNRQKRQLMRDNDDAMEYLLILMEYLLKQNHPLDAAPVNDGIDLLIDAIKSAPDIKPIKKKVLEYIVSTASPIKNLSEKLYDSNIYTENKNMRKFDKPSKQPKLAIDDNQSDPQKIQTTTVSTPYVYYNKIEDDDESYAESTTQNLAITAITYVPELIEKDAEKKIERVKIITNKIVSEEDESSEKNNNNEINRDKGERQADTTELKKFEVYTAGTEDDEVLPSESTTTSTTEGTEVIIVDVTSAETTTELKSDIKTRRHSFTSHEVSSETQKPKLDWVEDDLGKELKMNYFTAYQGNTTNMRTTEVITTPSVVTARLLVAQKRADISSITEEVGDRHPVRTKTTKMNPEEVMYRKQMDLLNSLDYVTDRLDFDDSDSKDSEVTDTFPSYFG